MSKKREMIKKMVDEYNTVLNSGTKEEIVSFLKKVFPKFYSDVAGGLSSLDRDEVAKLVRRGTRVPILAPERVCPICNQEMDFEEASCGPRPGAAGKYLCYNCMRFEFYLDKKSIQLCPQCRKEAYSLYSICGGCKESEGGYKSLFECSECGFRTKSKDPVSVWLGRLNVDFGTQTKESLGIKTVTDDGVK